MHRRKKAAIVLAAFPLFVWGVVQSATAAQALGPNLVNNPSLETVDVNGSPTCFARTGYGTNTIATATVAGHTGTRAAQIQVKTYTSGDWKEIQAESAACAPKVTAGHVYRASVWYHSTTANNSLTVFSHSTAGWKYWTDLKAVPASAAWAQVAANTPAIPAGVDQISFGVSIFGVGTLATDDYSLNDTATTTPSPSSSAPSPPGCTAACATGSWTVLPFNNHVRSVHAIVLHTGKVLMMAGSGNDPTAFAAGTFKSTLFDPSTSTFTDVATPYDMFCSGHVILPDGNVLIMGGTKSYPNATTGASFTGVSKSYIFNVATSAYTAVNNMNDGHWYPSSTELGNGDIVSLGGIDTLGDGTVQTEYFQYSTKQWLPENQVHQTYSWWGLYPTMILMADGRLFYTGSHTFGDNLPTPSSIYDYNAGNITGVPGLRYPNLRDQSAAVLLPPAQAQKVMIFGGGDVNTNAVAGNTTDIADLSNPATAKYVPGPNIPYGTSDDEGMESGSMGKGYVSAVLLPDGNVMELNGALHDRADNVHEASIYSPITNQFTSVPPDPIGRGYHNEAVLLPDGRILSVGGNPGDGSFEMRMSMYTPGYLFAGTRPTVGAVAGTFGYGSSQAIPFTVAAGASIRSAQLMKPAAVTHSSDSNVRSVNLPFTVTGNTLTAAIPTNRNLLTPGYYMLSVTDSTGVPSVAKWVLVQ